MTAVAIEPPNPFLVGATDPVTPAAEERQARAQAKHMERMRSKAAHAREATIARSIREAVAETKPKNKTCRCDFRDIKTKEQLQGMGGGCAMPAYVCPRLNAIRLRVKAWSTDKTNDIEED